MIFVTLGTQNMQFTRLLKEIDKSINDGFIKEKVIVQAGYTKYKSSNMEIFDYADPKIIEKYRKEASLVITHGGVGSILEALTLNKPVIAVARLKKYNEHTNDHQLQIVNEFASLQYILKYDDGEDFNKVLNKAKKFNFKKYKANNDNFNILLENYIKKTNHVSWLNKFINLFHNKK